MRPKTSVKAPMKRDDWVKSFAIGITLSEEVDNRPKISGPEEKRRSADKMARA